VAGNGSFTIWIGTKKGAFPLTSTGSRDEAFKVGAIQFLGADIFHVVQDPRNPSALLMAAKTGHLGPTVYSSGDGGKTWAEAARPPQFEKTPEGPPGPSVARACSGFRPATNPSPECGGPAAIPSRTAIRG